MWQGRAALALLPVAGSPPLMAHRKHRRLRSCYLIHYGVGKVLEMVAVRSVFILGPIAGSLGQAVDGLKHFSTKCVRRDRASLEVPAKRCANIGLRVGKNDDGETSHRVLRRCFTSDQGNARTTPERNSLRRRLTSSRHASEMLAVSASSRLSSNAAATAERSSAVSARTSSKTWSTRAFMDASLALNGLPHNKSVNTDAHGRPLPSVAPFRGRRLRSRYVSR
jgi:hypothetical protein